ncbi:hypothetical protein T484DRAFT_1666558 [Baffinella frigidus]|nr:hypothetical protein T484DRAFT_1666558 [Cryptophyta sp. CCMP2293]
MEDDPPTPMHGAGGQPPLPRFKSMKQQLGDHERVVNMAQVVTGLVNQQVVILPILPTAALCCANCRPILATGCPILANCRPILTRRPRAGGQHATSCHWTRQPTGSSAASVFFWRVRRKARRRGISCVGHRSAELQKLHFPPGVS